VKASPQSRLWRARALRALLGLAALLAGACGRWGGDELRPLDCRLDRGVLLRGLFAGERLLYAFTAAPELRVLMVRELPVVPPAGLVFCFGVEDGLYLDGRKVERPGPIFALRADGRAVPIELSAGQRKELERHLRHVRAPLEDGELLASLLAPLELPPAPPR
jgi:hypothetical protein